MDNIEDIYPLSPMQQGMLFQSLYAPESGVYVIQFMCALPGDLDISLFEQAWHRIIERHPILRTTFHWQEDDEMLQVVHSSMDLTINRRDWRDLPPDVQQAQLDAFLEADERRGFELSESPVMRMNLIRRSEATHTFIWSFHHLTLDGWSVAPVMGELFAIYMALRTGQELPLEPCRPYSDYIAWLQEQDHAAAEAFWRRALNGISAPTPLGLDTLDSPAAASSKSYAEQQVTLSKATTTALYSLTRQHQLTLNTIFGGAWSILLSHYSGEDDVVFGATVSGRPAELPGVETMVGLFLNTLPMRTRVLPDVPLIAWLKEIQTQQAATRQYDYSSLVDIQKWSAVPRGVPLFESILVLENVPAAGPTQANGGATFDDAKFRQKVGSPLTIIVMPGDTVSVKVLYDCTRFDPATITRILGHWQTLLESIAACSDKEIGDLAILPQSERAQVLVEWNRIPPVAPQQPSLYQLFEAQAARTPSAIAVMDQTQSLTYGVLNSRANQLAHFLRAQGVGPEVLVGVCVSRSADMIVALLGILKAGGAYVPLDPSYPKERLATIVADSQIKILLTQQSLVDVLPEHNAAVVCLDSDWPLIAYAGIANLPAQARASNVAYIIYTSGSTGKPKGIAITHHSACVFVAWAGTVFSPAELQGVLAATSLCFDLSVFEIFVPLSYGGSLIVVDNALQLPESVHRAKVTLVNTVPSAMAELLRSKSIGPSVLSVNLAGEALQNALVQRIYQQSAVQRVYNMYGPSEDTVYSTAMLVDRLATRNPPIGRPISNSRAYILDRALEPVPFGVKGELYIGGEGLGRGYLDRPDLTAERFVPDPFATVPGARLYKTGDVVRYLSDGNLDYLGRSDHQVKIRGFRIELGEIEARLLQHPAVQEAVVIVREDTPGIKRLVAYIVAPSHPSVAELRPFVGTTLPDYMVPATIVTLPALPLTSNGKINRKALPVPEQIEPSTFVEDAPLTAVEQTLAGIYARVLGQEHVRSTDNFFELGGDSILSLQVVARAAEAGLRLTPKQLFQYPAIRDLAQIVGTIPTASADQDVVTGPVPLSPIHHWFFERNLPDAHHFNQAFLLDVNLSLDLPIFEQAIQHVFAHHDALRLRFERRESGVAQSHADLDATQVPLERHDIARLSPDEQRAAIAAIAADAQAGFDLANAPLLRVLFFDRGPQATARLLIVAHHLVIDGVSWRILLEDLQAAYADLLQGQPPHLPAKTTAFKAWIEHLHAYAQTEKARTEAQYWFTQAGDGPMRHLPVDQPGADNSLASAQTCTVALSAAQTQALLHAVPAAYNTRIQDVLVTALAQTIVRWTGNSIVRVDMEGHGREELFEDVDLSRTIGWFTSLYPVTFDLIEAPTPGNALQTVKEQLRRIPNNGVGYGLLRYLSDEPQFRKGLAALPKAEISFNYLGQFDQIATESAFLRPVDEPYGAECSLRGQRSHLLEVNSYVANGGLTVQWTFSNMLHQPETIERLAHDFLAALDGLIEHCRSANAGSFTPSDFPLVTLNQTQLDAILQTACGTTGRAAKERVQDIYPLSPMQQGMLFHSLAAAHTGVYIEQLMLTFDGGLDGACFERAWQSVVDRHPILRTAFVWEQSDSPVQVVRRDIRMHVEQTDLRHLTAAQQNAWLATFEAENRARGFVFSEAPLQRLALIRLSEQSYRFIWTHHHILLDGWSVAVLFEEVTAFYAAFSAHQEPTRAPVRAYRDYIAWLQARDTTEAQSFWRQTLAGITEPTPLGVDTRRSLNATEASYAQHELRLSPALTDALSAMARQHQFTLNTLFQGAWALVLGCYGGQDDVVFGTTVSGRPAELAGIETILGPFINTLPVRVRMTAQSEVVPWLQALQEEQSLARQYDYSSLTDIQGWNDIPRGTPLFESLVVFENFPVSMQPQEGAAFIRDMRSRERTNYPLTLVGIPGAELVLKALYDCSRFEESTIVRLVSHVQTVLEALAVRQDRPLATVPIMSVAEQQTLREWQGTRSIYPAEECCHNLFEAQVARVPDDIAVVYGNVSLSYAELNARANQLAHYLRTFGVGPDALVAIYMERSVDLIITTLAILKAGGAYVPLDLSYPKERIAFMLADSQATVLITHSDLVADLPAHRSTVICLDRDADHITLEPATNPANITHAANLAYVIYTSGSTGVPKGVCIPHRGIVRMVFNTNYMCFDGSDRIAQVSNTSFDAATFEIWAALLHGARLVGITKDILLSPQEFAAQIETQGVTTLFLTTAFFNQQAREYPAIFRSLRYVLTGGEAADAQWFREVLAHNPPQHLLNLYGPTENTTYTTFFDVSQSSAISESATSLPIGRPITNTTTYVLDSSMQRVPIGVPGELYTGGEGLARGYHDRPDLTAERFVPDPFSTVPGARLYKTGDLVRLSPDGNLDFLGRSDHQVKLRGFRIELGEIETSIARYPAVQDCAVILREDIPGLKRLVAYIVPRIAATLTIADVRRDLKVSLPEYMQPSAYVLLPALPLTANGKIDHRALPMAEPLRAELQDTYIAPRDGIEAQMVSIWQTVLGVQPIGITDNFFALGGHSLLALRLLAQIHAHFGTTPPLSLLLHEGTVAALADAVRQPVATATPLVALQPYGSRPPFFCVHPGSGHVLCYQELVTALGSEQPFYGLQDPHANGSGTPYADIATMAADYIVAMRTAQATGPYYLGGWSFGGVVAFEMARQLTASGETVALVALLDSGSPAQVRRSYAASDATTLLAIVLKELSGSDDDLALLRAALAAQDETARLSYAAGRISAGSMGLGDVSAEWVAGQVAVFAGRIHALQTYDPQPYSGRVTLLRATGIEEEMAQLERCDNPQNETPALLNDFYGWDSYVSQPVVVRTIPGTHAMLVHSPQVEIVADVLRPLMDAALLLSRLIE